MTWPEAISYSAGALSFTVLVVGVVWAIAWMGK